MEAHILIRRARHDAGLTQEQLAGRLGVSQAALARLERSGANPTIATLDRVLRAAGRRLDLRLGRPEPTVDEGLLSEALRLSPAERIAGAERLLADAESLAAAGARSRA
ncbi:MAG: helix-turn-helix domain-containing protein [Thermoleophilaceae bacterium]